VQYVFELFTELAGHSPPFVDGMLGGGFMYLLIHLIGGRWRIVRISRKEDDRADNGGSDQVT
jgi:hypothetical protein